MTDTKRLEEEALRSLRSAEAKKPKEVVEDITPYDWEILLMEKVLHKLNQKTVLPQDIELFHQEVKERFAEINWRVEVQLYDTTQEGTYIMRLILQGRITPIVPTGESDFERRQWEVRQDILEIAPDIEKGSTVKFNPDQLHPNA